MLNKTDVPNNFVYRISYNVAWQIAPSREYVYVQNIRTGEFFKLCDSAMEIWCELYESGTIENCVSRVSKLYHVDEEEALRDIKDFISELINAGMLEKETQEET